MNDPSHPPGDLPGIVPGSVLGSVPASGRSSVPANVVVLDRPLVQHKLTRLRQASTSTAGFRRLAREISLLMAYEATRDLPLEQGEIETPLERTTGQLLPGKKPCL